MSTPRLRFLADESCDFAVVRAKISAGLVFISHVASPGVILKRFPGNARQTLARAVVQAVQGQGEKLIGAFVVIQPGYIRIGRRPGAQD
jgi:hypothetical protein